MLDKNFLQSFLRVNNASPDMSDAEVRTVLGRAGWSESEIAAAIVLLRTETPSVQKGEANLPFRPDMEFSSSQLSELLGVDVVIDPGRMHTQEGILQGTSFSLRHALSVMGIIFLATGLALGAGIFSAYMFEIGPFQS